MALASAFHERLQQMEEARNQRLALLQAEKELQAKKSLLLSSKLSNLRRMEQRCLLLQRRHAEAGFRILATKSEIDALDARYQATARELSLVKREIGELEGREQAWDRFYQAKRSEMEQFRELKTRFEADTREEVQKLRNLVAELKSTFKDLQDNDMYSKNAEIATAEARKAELIAKKAKLDQSLASAHQFRALLHKQLQRIFSSQNGDNEKKNLKQ